MHNIIYLNYLSHIQKMFMRPKKMYKLFCKNVASFEKNTSDIRKMFTFNFF